MSDDYADQESFYAGRRAPDKFTYSDPFTITREYEGSPPVAVGDVARYAYQVFDSPYGHVTISTGKGGEIILRETATRQQIKALFFQGDRAVSRLILQRFNSAGKKLQDSFNLAGHEVQMLRDFLHLIETVELDENDGGRPDAATVRQILSAPEMVQEVYESKRNEIFALIEDDANARDVLALKRKRDSLAEFQHMLTDTAYFEGLRRIPDGGRLKQEDVWQRFFEKNRWLFGLGLASQVLLSWEEGKLEQTIVGRSIAGPGHRVDALMHTGGSLSSICLVEIKRHDTDLLEPAAYRVGAWRAAEHLSGGIAQCHTNAASLVREFTTITQKDKREFPTGKVALVSSKPRSYLVIGSLTEFMEDGQTNDAMFASFENLRRSLTDLEILTFDELYARAELILAGFEETSSSESMK